MTRQKKELVRKIDEIEAFIAADEAMGCGSAPAGFYEPLERKAWGLMEELAHLCHYRDAMEMMYDTRGCKNEGIPFV